MNLTQLDGFEPTELEKLVAGNPSFQQLRRQGLPIKFGELTTGLRLEKTGVYDQPVAFKPTDKVPLNPNEITKFFDKLSPALRSVLVLAAKVTRDAGENEADHELVRDLCFWLDQADDLHFKGFRWERYVTERQATAKHQAYLEQIKQLYQGESEIVVILRNRLTPDEFRALRDSIEHGWFDRYIPQSSDCLPQYDRVRQIHFPACVCLNCANLSLQHRRPGGMGPKYCQDPGAIVLVDPDDISEIISLIPRKLQRLVRIARFKVPRSTFTTPMSPHYSHPYVFPRMLIFGLELLGPDQKQTVEQTLTLYAKKKHQLFTWPMDLIRPAKNRFTNALILSSEGIRDDDWFYDWSFIGRSLKDHFEGFPITVTMVGSY